MSRAIQGQNSIKQLLNVIKPTQPPQWTFILFQQKHFCITLPNSLHVIIIGYMWFVDSSLGHRPTCGREKKERESFLLLDQLVQILRTIARSSTSTPSSSTTLTESKVSKWSSIYGSPMKIWEFEFIRDRLLMATLRLLTSRRSSAAPLLAPRGTRPR